MRRTTPAPPPPSYDLPANLDLSLDNDQDGLEDRLIANFMPWIWFDSGENYGCSAPAASWSPGKVMARARPHPADPSKIAIQYVVLYNKDCGDLFGWTGHRGDVEPFALTLSANPSCPDGYGVYAVHTVAHEGTSGETRETAYLGGTCNYGRLNGSEAYLFSAENKHGNYITKARCDRGGFLGADACSFGFRLPYDADNAGEPTKRRINNLYSYAFPGEYVWSAYTFCGSLGSCSTGPVHAKLTKDSLLAPAY